jgi:hypothetical protein
VQKSYYNEKEARDLCRILLDSIKYCHDRDVVHRCVTCVTVSACVLRAIAITACRVTPAEHALNRSSTASCTFVEQLQCDCLRGGVVYTIALCKNICL